MKHYIKSFLETANRKKDCAALSNYGGKSYTFGEILNRFNEMHNLFQQIGVEKGDHVALCGKSTAEWAAAFLAISSYHAVVVPLLNEFTSKDIESLTAHADSVVLITEEKTFKEIDCNNIPTLKAVIEIVSNKILYSKDWHQSDYQIDNNFDDLNELNVINYTSGTTGNPKGVMLTAANLTSNIQFALDRIPVSDGDRIVSMLPMAHMYGLAFECLYPVTGGADVVFMGKTPSPAILLKALSEVKPYILITVPLVLEKIFKSKVLPVLNGSAGKIPVVKNILYSVIRKKLLTTFGGNLRMIIAGGAAMNERVEKAMRKIGLPYTIGYGMTECAPLLAYEEPKKFRPGSCGKPVDRMELRIDSYDPINVPGEIQAKGMNVTLGYYKNEEKTKELFTNDGWLRTGDLGIMDYQKNVIIKGRIKCMILSSNGQNIYPEEIEDKLNGMNWISESVVLQRGKVLVGIIALKDEYKNYNKKDELIEHIKKDVNKVLPSYSQLAKIEVIENFEHTPKHSIKRFKYK